MMGIFAPFSELSPESLIVQSSRCSPTRGKLASPCFREACLSCETFESRHAVRTLLMMAIGGKAYAWRLTQGWRNASTPAALGSHAGAKNTGSLAVSEAGKRSMIAGHW